jgi:hypothetical protein
MKTTSHSEDGALSRCDPDVETITATHDECFPVLDAARALGCSVITRVGLRNSSHDVIGYVIFCGGAQQLRIDLEEPWQRQPAKPST